MSSGSDVTNERERRFFVSTYAPGPYAAGAGEYQVHALATELSLVKQTSVQISSEHVRLKRRLRFHAELIRAASPITDPATRISPALNRIRRVAITRSGSLC